MLINDRNVNRPKNAGVAVTAQDIENSFRDSVFTFYVTGSRLFGGATKDSDWDYFTEDSDEVREFLEVSLGFRPLSQFCPPNEPGNESPFKEETIDYMLCDGLQQLASVYRREVVIIGSGHNSWIDVQLVKNAERKHKIQRHLLTALNSRLLDGTNYLNLIAIFRKKKCAPVFWRLVYNVYFEGMREAGQKKDALRK